MAKKRIMDAAIYVMENFTEEEIKNLKQMNIINNTVVLAIEVKKCFDKQTVEGLMNKYTHTAEDMGISVKYVRKLLKE